MLPGTPETGSEGEKECYEWGQWCGVFKKLSAGHCTPEKVVLRLKCSCRSTSFIREEIFFQHVSVGRSAVAEAVVLNRGEQRLHRVWCVCVCV